MKLSKIQNKNYLTLISILWPFLGVIMAIKYYNKFSTKNAIYAFFVLFGFTLVIDPVMDSSRYAESLKDDYSKPFEETSFYFRITNLYEESLDFSQSLVNFIVSRFTDSHHILFALYAIIFGFFWLKTLNYLNSHFSFNKNIMTIIYAVFLISIIPIFNINGFRMWTAAWIFLYGAFHIILTKNPKYFLFCLAACSFHFSFITANALLLVWYFIGNHKWAYLAFALISFTIAELNLSFVQSFAESLGPAFSTKANAYTSEEYVEQVSNLKSNDAWFMVLSPKLIKYLLLINILRFFYISCKKIEIPKPELNLLNFTLLFLGYSNLFSVIPSGGRFVLVFNVFGAVLSIVLFSKYLNIKINSIYGLTSLGVALLATLITIRAAAPSINTILFAPSFLIPFGYDLDWSLTTWLF